MFLAVPAVLGSVVTQSTVIQVRGYYRNEEQKQMDQLSRLELREDSIAAGEARIGPMIATPNVFCVNNHGDVSARDGSDINASQGTLMKHQWHMPMLVLGIAAGERAGLSFTISIREKAFNFRTIPLATEQADIGGVPDARAR